MIILHNSLDKESREFVAQHATPADTIYDWHDRKDFALWVGAGGTQKVSAFPSVVVDIPAHDSFDPDDEFLEEVPAHQEALRKIKDIDDLNERIDKINLKLEKHNSKATQERKVSLVENI